MNQNDNNNKSEILDPKGRECQQKYPFAEAPDVMNPCMEKAYTRGQSADVSNATSTTTAVTSQLLSLKSPLLSVAGGIIKVLIKILWPTGTQQEWGSFMNAVEQLINVKLDTLVRNEAIAKLEGLKEVLGVYVDKITIYTDNPSEAHAQSLKNQADITNNIFVSSMPSFKIRDYEIQLLTVYAQAANLYLAFLRDIVKFGAEWGFTPTEIANYHKSMKERTEEYTNYCVETYNKGLEKAKTLNATLCDLNTYPWIRYNQGWREEEKPNCSSQQINDYDPQLNECLEKENPNKADFRWSIGEYQKLEDWNLYNAYRRDMTIMILDVVSLWPTYDPVLYPTSFGVKSELTRELYTDIRGTTYRSDESQNKLTAIEGRMIPPPQLFRWLSSLNFHLRKVGTDPNDNWTYGEIATGLQSTVQKTLTTPEVLPLDGTTGTHTKTLNPLDYADGITWIDTQQWFEPRWFQFWSGGYSTVWKSHGTFGSIEEKNPFWAAGPTRYIYDKTNRSSQIPVHRLSWITYEPVRENAPFVWPQYKQLGAVALGWTHQSVDLNSTIVSDKITSIPAVKAFRIVGPTNVIKGPGSTGGDLVELLPNGTLDISVVLSTQATDRNYKLRIRYASRGNTTLFVKQTHSIFSNGNYYTINQTTTNDQLTYSTFRYLEKGDLNTISPKISLHLKNTGNSAIIIDKFEFIPYTPTPEPEPPQ